MGVSDAAFALRSEGEAAVLTSRWIAAMRAQDYELAWALSARTLMERDPAKRDDPALPYHLRWVWDGRRFDGKACLVRCYHGLGDTIQFARFLPLLAKRAASVEVEAQARLIPVLRKMEGGESIRWTSFDPAHPLPPAECDFEISELPFALRAKPEDARAPYLRVVPGIVPPHMVGLCHQAGEWDAERSLTAEQAGVLCSDAACLSLVPGPSPLAVLNPDGCPFDMEATAALIAACELVISVDTMIAHLAAAMGKPTWLLLKADPDWRWPAEGDRTPWYPSMRLYRQHEGANWAPVMKEVRHDLAAWTVGCAVELRHE